MSRVPCTVPIPFAARIAKMKSRVSWLPGVFLMSSLRVRSALRPAVLAVTTILALVTAGIVTAPLALAAGPPRIDLKVLVLTDNEPMVEAIAAELDDEGVPYTQLDLTSASRPVIDAAYLSDTVASVPRAKFQAVVLPNEAPAGLTPTELTALHTFEAAFGIRQVDASTWANPAVGLNYAASPGYVGTLDGITATVTPEGRAAEFRSLDGPVTFENADPVESESYGFVATPMADDPVAKTSFKVLMSAPMTPLADAGSLVGVYTHEGREELVITFNYNEFQEQFQTIAPSIVGWMTRGVHLGFNRNYFSVQVDDILIPDLRWSAEANCTPGDLCPPGTPLNAEIRMVPADVDHLMTWQTANGMPLDMTYNAEGAEDPADPLTTKLVTNKASFRWLNHTYSHPYLGCVQNFAVIPWVCATDAGGAIQYEPMSLITSQIDQNKAWAAANGITLDEGELVTGEHSGLKTLPQMLVDNPNLAPGLQASGIAFTASDASREFEQRQIGTTLTVPRYPMNIFYNVATQAEEVDEYNWIYNSRVDGGSGVCEDNPATSTCIAPLSTTTGFMSYIVPIEIRNATQHLLNNDPRPHYAHQSNLTEDKILYPVLDGILAKYNAAHATNTPLLHPSLRESGTLLKQAAAWKTNKAAVSAYAIGSNVTVASTSGSAIDVPVTLPEGTTQGGTAFGQAYAGERSAQVAFAASQTQQYVLPAGAGYPFTAVVAAAPVIGTATAGSASATVTWTAPTDTGGTAITGYEVGVVNSAGTQIGALRPAAAGATSLAVTGLTNGTAYRFQVRALNSVGASPYSAFSTAVTPSALPGVPALGTVTPGNASATVTWTAPASSGASAITGYSIRVYRSGSLINTIAVPATPLSRTFTGLINNQPHTFAIAAVNASGTSAYSAQSAPVTPTVGAPPGTPAFGAITAGNASATVNWTAPASTGGSAITGYSIRVYRSGSLINTIAVPATPLSRTFTGLTNGAPHTFAIAAVNAGGTSPYSAQSAAVTPTAGAVPGAPTISSVTAGNATATVNWAVPASTGGSAISGYSIRVYRSGTLINTVAVAASPRSRTFTGLINGQPHTFAVAAVNAGGTGAYSAQSAAVTPKGVPAAPVIGTATAGVASATIRWSAPTNNGGEAVTSYLVRSYRSGTLINTKTVAGSALSVVNTGLLRQPHRFSVAAVNAIGTSSYSAQSNQVVPT